MNEIENLITNAISNIRNMLDVNTIIGTPIVIKNSTTIVPITKVNAGFVAGGGEYQNEKQKKLQIDKPFAGGTGSGFSITPIGFLLFQNDDVKMISIENKPAHQELFDFILEICKKYKKGE